ncbi:ADP-ribosyltransferase [Frankia sp. AgB32]|uniref:ADP-ribosyltransferase n=1 Tax=Frankia sp. AgB32 TaxID=631119 RepID=UPI00200F719F|nr:ADP-ribosyltransferase [Frankia sp. AgB32]MCK9898144.1 ADP-ribosyltransferase [Frankia sp. AgB32]
MRVLRPCGALTLRGTRCKNPAAPGLPICTVHEKTRKKLADLARHNRTHPAGRQPLPSGTLRGKDADRYLAGLADADSIPEASRRAVWAYSGPRSPINPTLRARTLADNPDIARVVHDLDAAFDAVPPTTRPIVVHRGLRHVDRFLPPDATGFQHEDAGYRSTSTDINVAEEFTRFGPATATRMMVEIEIPAGSKVLPIEAIGTQFPGQNEVLFPRNSHIEFTSDDDRADTDGRPIRHATARLVTPRE